MKKNIRKADVKNIIIDHLNSNIKEYLVVVIIFFIGLFIGVLFLNNLIENQETNVGIYIEDFIQNLQENSEVNRGAVLRQSITSNLILVFVLWLAGSTIIGIPVVYGILAFRGFTLGYTLSVIISTLGIKNGVLFSIITVALKNIIFIPALFIIAVSGIRLYKSVINGGQNSDDGFHKAKGGKIIQKIKSVKTQNIKKQIIKHTAISIIIGVIFIISSFVEVYVGVNLLEFFVNLI